MQEYYNTVTMDMDDQPALFVDKLEALRERLSEKGYVVEDGQFVKDVLAKLPRSKGKEANVYQVQKRFIALFQQISLTQYRADP